MKYLIKFIIKREFYIFLFALPSLIVGYLGFNRPYYNTPDQDLLWVSQSIRLFKGFGPSYADHPGAYWPVSFLVKFFIFSRNSLSEFIDQYGAVSEELIDKVIHLSRIENALITSCLPLLIFLLLKELEVNKKVIILITYTLCLSSANLNLVSDIRHESIGLFFMFLYLLLTNKELNKPRNLHLLNFNAIINTLFFYASIFCKQQILLLYPLIFILILNFIKVKDKAYFKEIKGIFKRDNISNLLILFFLSGIPWIIISTEEFHRFGAIYFVNLPFWSFINSGLIFSMMLSAKERIAKSIFLKYLFVIIPIQILVFEILAPNVWRRSITSFPSILFKFTSLYDGDINLFLRLKEFIIFTKKYSISLSWPSNLFLLIIFSLTIYFFIRLLKFLFNKGNFSLLDYSFFILLTLTGILSLRQSPFYQNYFFIPILILLSLGYGRNFLEKNNIREKFQINNFLFLTTSILLLSFFIKSTFNIFNLNKFVSLPQSIELLCAPQTLDYSLKNTPAGKCNEFENESYKKNKFNSWI